MDFDASYNRDEFGAVYIVDEASMISNESEDFSPFGTGRLLDDLVEYCFGAEGARILLAGTMHSFHR